MSEKEKMLRGELYTPEFDEELMNEQKRVKDLCFKLNNTLPSNVEERNQIIKEIFGSIGKNVYIEPPFFCDYGYNIKLGNDFYINHNSVMLDAGTIEFGNNVFIGPNCGFYTSGHPIEAEIRNTYQEYAKPIKIGNSVWIGGNVCVMPGVTTGDNVVIGAGSVVTKDIPSNVIAVGSPCKVIKEINNNGEM